MDGRARLLWIAVALIGLVAVLNLVLVAYLRSGGS